VKFLLDTDRISILQRQAGPEFAVLVARIGQHPPDDLAFSVVSFQEQVLGCNAYLSRARTSAEITRGYSMLARVREDFCEAQMLPFDGQAAATLDGLATQRVRLAAMDLRIACIALSRGLTVLTRNTRDFGRVPGLVTEDWTI
jgi:tRNA(fMet)-specific endonuclease VapC